MYNIFELKSKTLPELKEIASQLGIQVNNNTQAEELVYTILDEQAISASKVSVQNGEGKKRKKEPVLPKPKTLRLMKRLRKMQKKKILLPTILRS